MTVQLNSAANASSVTLSVTSGTVASNQAHGNRSMPPVVPASELYFWTNKWQTEERAFEEARARGELRSFGSADEAIRALLSD